MPYWVRSVARLTVAGMAGGKLGRQLASDARAAYLYGMHGALLVGAIVVAMSALLVVIAFASAGPHSERGSSVAIRECRDGKGTGLGRGT